MGKGTINSRVSTIEIDIEIGMIVMIMNEVVTVILMHHSHRKI